MTLWFVGPSVIDELMVAEALSWRVVGPRQADNGHVSPAGEARPPYRHAEPVKLAEVPAHV